MARGRKPAAPAATEPTRGRLTRQTSKTQMKAKSASIPAKRAARRSRPVSQKGKLIISGKDLNFVADSQDEEEEEEVKQEPIDEIEDSDEEPLSSVPDDAFNDFEDSSDELSRPTAKTSSHVAKKRRTGISSNIAVVIDNKRTSRVSRGATAPGESPASVMSNASSVSRTFDESPAAETPMTSMSMTSTRASSHVASRKARGKGAANPPTEEEIALSTTLKGKGVSQAASTPTPRRVSLRASTLLSSTTKSRAYDASSEDEDDEPFEVSEDEAGLSDAVFSSEFEPEEAEEAVEDDDDEEPVTTSHSAPARTVMNSLHLNLEDTTDDALEEPAPRPVAARRTNRSRRVPKMTRAERERGELYKQHPYLESIWEDLENCEPIPVEKAPQPDGLSLTMLPFQLEGLNWLKKQERTRFNGGILADEMGMGKTIQTIALLMEMPRPKRPTLVVAPTVALIQWRNEIEKHTNNALKVLIFHGQSKENKAAAISKYDVVLTTYGSLESVFRKQTSGFKRKAGIYKEDSVLHSINWYRVVLDEAHNIKDRSCNTARAVFALKTQYKLCLSGTPLQNRIGELFSLLRFLECDPFSMYFCRKCPCKSMHWKFKDYKSCDDCGHRPMEHICFFNYDILKPIQNYGHSGKGKAAFKKLHSLLKLIMLRRTKVQRADDLGLPPRVVKVRRDYFNEEELDLYESIYSDSRRKFNTYVAAGVVLNNYANIFSLITRMRQIADHPDLVLRRHAAEGNNNLVCCICDEEAEEAIKSKCHHTFCRMCVQKYIESYAGGGDPDCPHCHIALHIDLTQPALEADYDLVKKGSIINRIDINNWRSSTKIEALVEELAKLRSKNCTIKTIVFSQFTSMLQLVEWRLRKAGFLTVMLEGSMSPAQRDASIRYFMENVQVEVFLVSLKAGGVALNLVEASQVYIMDPWWNPSVEWQSGDRIHRIGQTRNCRITRLVIEDSIESRIIELQEKKANMINATIGADQGAMDKLSPADMQFLFNN
ncbi:hypothetical protein ABW20_dc0106560 [Dactylellina cionopaga]|nr:hypothetical protein ABW20_dc0106560 [Dactylellina cionopaga]